MSDFLMRARPHDEVGIPLVQAELSKLGAAAFGYGVEQYPRELARAMLTQRDDTAYKVRFAPDLVPVWPGLLTLFCEVKTESQGSDNFAVEADAYRGSLLHDSGGMVLYAFVDLTQRTVVGCWARDIKTPRRILVPNRPDYKESQERMYRNFPQAKVEAISWRNGSGTPFFLIPKRWPVFLPFSVFMVQRGPLAPRQAEQGALL